MCKFRDRRQTYRILLTLDRACRSDVENGLVFAGSSDSIQSVSEIMAALVRV